MFPHLARLSILGMRLGILGMRSRLSNEVVSPLPLWFSAREVHLHRVVMITWGRQVGGRGGPGGGGGGYGT